MFQLPSDFKWLMPWSAIAPESRRSIEKELRREMPRGHRLAGCRFKAIGESENDDDFLFATDHPEMPLATVHLTWSKESAPAWPSTVVYRSVKDWIEAMEAEHIDFIERFNGGGCCSD